MNKATPILITGTAGFIGFHLAKRLLDEGYLVVGIDIINDYYDVKLKESRNKLLKENSNYTFFKFDLTNQKKLSEIFNQFKFKHIVHLAGQAGVRYSLINPFAYIEANITSFINILTRCKEHSIEHLIYASSSSVYGLNTKMPFMESEPSEHPVSLYGATKKANEMMAHAYSANFLIPTTGLRFFTVYGPWGRPDMALFLFTKSIIEGKAIDVYNEGEMKRDFTYVDDIVEGIFRLLPKSASRNPHWNSEYPLTSSSSAPYSIYNIGNNSPVNLMDFIKAIERQLGKEAKLNYLPLQTGDVPVTYADSSSLGEKTGFTPSTDINTGITNFLAWYKDYYKIK